MVTKDLELVKNMELRELLRRGPGYRVRPLPPRPMDLVAMEARFPGLGRAGLLLVDMVEGALTAFGEKCEEVLGVSPASLWPWSSSVVTRVAQQAAKLTAVEQQEIQDWADAGGASRTTRYQWSAAMDAELAQLQRSFVMAPADKETGVITFTCKEHWLAKLWSEVHTTPTYEVAGVGAESFILQRGAQGREQPPRDRRRATGRDCELADGATWCTGSGAAAEGSAACDWTSGCGSCEAPH